LLADESVLELLLVSRLKAVCLGLSLIGCLDEGAVLGSALKSTEQENTDYCKRFLRFIRN